MRHLLRRGDEHDAEVVAAKRAEAAKSMFAKGIHLAGTRVAPAVLLAVPGDDPSFDSLAVPAHGSAVAAPTVDGDGPRPAIDVRDASVPEAHRVIDNLFQSLIVRAAYDVQVRRRGAPSDEHDRGGGGQRL